ncbi:Guanidinobutyrase [hydrothermal vent metagenome]|uniref:Guanidinobutyrase n=1 Tax=hydrothermal vent metagenome TaxID=652676 RepID=A0A3B0VHS9_9ZZZZ
MTKNHYQPLDAMVYPRFSGIRTFMRLPHVTDLEGVDLVITVTSPAPQVIYPNPISKSKNKPCPFSKATPPPPFSAASRGTRYFFDFWTGYPN